MSYTTSDHQYPVNRVSILESHAAKRHTEITHLKDQINLLTTEAEKNKGVLEARIAEMEAEMEAKLDKIFKMLSWKGKIGCKQTQPDHVKCVTAASNTILPCNIVFVKISELGIYLEM